LCVAVLEQVQNLIKIPPKYTHLIQIASCFHAFPMFWNVASTRERFHCANDMVVLRSCAP